MSYNPNIPLSTDRPSQSQGQILTNFQQLDSIFAINHVTFDDATVANRGKHTYVTLIDETATPPTPSGTDIALYSAVASGVNELFYIQGAVGTPIQITGAGSPGSSFEIRGGTFTYPLGSLPNPVTITFSSPFPTSVVSVVITPTNIQGPDLRLYVSSQTVAHFIVTPRGTSGANATFNYIAIGT